MVGGGQSIFYRLPLILFGDDYPSVPSENQETPLKLTHSPPQGKIYELSLLCSPF